MKKKIILSLMTAVLVVGGVAVLSAYEDRIVNVTARIGGSLVITPEEIDFGTVPAEGEASASLTLALSEEDEANEDEDSEPSCSSVNLIQNGGFEMPEVTDPAGWQLFPTSSAGLSWTVNWQGGSSSYQGKTRPSPALQELQENIDGWLAQEGNQYAELDSDWDGPNGSLTGEPALTRIYQIIPTTKGTVYKLSYYFSPRPGTAETENVLTVKVNGETLASHAASGAGKTQTQWNYFEKSFTAEESSAKIEFIGGGTANSIGTFLDNVKLVECGSEENGDEIKYTIRQKPKCVDSDDPDVFLPVTKKDDKYVCPEGSEMVPNLCSYLSKTETTEDGDEENDGEAVEAFHGSAENWTVKDTKNNETFGRLGPDDLQDSWTIGLEAPCFEDSCPDEWPHEGYELDEDLEGELLGCDLWIEIAE